MRVFGWTGVHVHVKESDRIEVPSEESRLFGRLTQARLFGCFARVHVASRLHPDAKALVQMQNDAARRDHERRRRQMVSVGVFIERIAGPGQAIEGLLDRLRLAFIDR